MGYKLLGFAVWQVGKRYVSRRYSGAPRKAGIAAVAGLAVAGGLAVALRHNASD
jgi:hypothetical protein